MSGETTASEGASDCTGAANTGQRLAIKVKTLEPATYDLDELSEETTVGALKEALQRVTASHVEAERQRILFCGRVLSDDSATLAASGVKDGHTLHMVERPPDVPPQPQNNAPPEANPQARGGLHFSQEFPGAGGVQRIAIGTLNPGGLGLDTNGGTPESLISGLMSAISREIQRGGGGAVNSPTGSGAEAANGAPGAAHGQGEAAAGGVGVGGGAFPSGVQLQQLEINIDAVPASSQGMPSLNPMNLAAQRSRGIRNMATERHPIQVLHDFIPRLQGIMDDYTVGCTEPIGPIVNAGEHEATNREAQHIAVECDICGACPIRGPRFKSLSHDNYDLCQACVKTEAAREQEPYVLLELPLCNQLNTESLLPSTSIPLRHNPSSQRLRAATRQVLEREDSRRRDSGLTVNERTWAGTPEEPSEQETAEERGERERRDREALRDQTIETVNLMLGQISTLLTTAEHFVTTRPGVITEALDLEDPVRREQALQGNLLASSSVLNGLGGMLIEMGRLLGGVHLPIPSNRIVLGPSLSYIHPNGSQAIIPPPAGGSSWLGGGILTSGGPGGILESLRATMASRNPSGSPRAPASNPTGVQERPTAPVNPTQPPTSTAVAAAASSGNSQQQAPSLPGAPPPAVSSGSQNVNVPQTSTETRPAQAQAESTITSFPVVVNHEEDSSGGAASLADLPSDPMRAVVNALEQSGISDPEVGIDRAETESAAAPDGSAKAEDDSPGSSGKVEKQTGEKTEKTDDDGKEKKPQDDPEASGGSNQKEDKPKSKNAIGLGSGLRPRKTVIRRVKKKEESSGPSSASTSRPPMLPKRSAKGSSASAIASTNANANAGGSGSGSAVEMKSPLGDLMGSFMPMMNQLLGEDKDSDDDHDSDVAAVSGGVNEGVGDRFETSLQQNLTEEEQQRWKALIENDQLEQEEMRLPEPFSDTYLSLGRTKLE